MMAIIVAEYNVNGNFNCGNYLALKEAIEAGDEIGCNSENGYRVTNVREAALMSLYCSNTWWDNSYTMVGTWYSNGNTTIGGTGNDKNYYSWQFGYRSATIGRARVNSIRSVRDWHP